MGIIYATTHLVMAICTVCVFYFALKPEPQTAAPENSPQATRFYIRGLKLIQVIATTGYKIATTLLITYIR